MATTHKVVWGDTLSQLAITYNTTVANLVKWNNIKDPDFIVVGQILRVSADAPSPTNPKKPTLSKATVTVFGLQSGTDRTMYATWTWTGSNTDHYETKWTYDTGNVDGNGKTIWFNGSDGTPKDNQETYSAPSNAKRVRFKVKPISKTYKQNDKDVKYWTADWSTVDSKTEYSFSSNPPTKPSAPNVTIEDFKLTAELENLDVNGTTIEFQVVKDDTTVFKTGKANIVTSSASFSCTVEAGGQYKVRCRAVRDTKYSEWSEYSSNVETIPSAPTGITVIKASSDTSVYLEWSKVQNAETYDIEYATKITHFDGTDQTQTVSGIEFTHFDKSGLSSGEQYFFRVRAVNGQGQSSWSEIKSIILGEKPAAPTTWSSTTTNIVGEMLYLYWVHNAKDGSSQTFAELELTIDGIKSTYTVKNERPEEEKDKTTTYEINTSTYKEGTKILWRVRTAGITKAYGDWSVERTVDVYAPPTLSLSVTNSDGDLLQTITSFPFYIKSLAGPKTQAPIGYHVVIKSNDAYESVDNIGNVKMVNIGEEIYSKYFDTGEALLVEFTPGNVDLANNINYTATVTVTMNSGLTASESSDFNVAWADEEYEPNAEIGVDKETLSAYIRPYCEDENGNLVSGVSLSVYRREYDGSFVELAKGIDNIKSTFITDPHPALDYARYRIVAISNTTGAISFYDVPGYYVGDYNIVIQWAEEWSNFDTNTEDSLVKPAWSGSMLKLPYNINVSESNSKDEALVEYIGREHPVSYFGTQLGEGMNLSTDVDATDKETIYALRRLKRWMGNVYIREPSGNGYWATVKVSFNINHMEVTIPVSINVTRVEGGV